MMIGIMLLTYYGGNGLGQSSAHELMGLVTFALAILGMFALDSLLDLFQDMDPHKVWRKRKRKRMQRHSAAMAAVR